DGQLYVNLRGYAAEAPVRPIEALAGFLHALAGSAEQVPAELADATARYRSLLADKRVLVVLDNAAHPDQVRPLLPGGGGCLVLVTSRNQLGGLAARDGADRLVLGTLTPEDARTLLTRLLGHATVQAEPAAVAELAELCGHLPLAVRIAAANVTTGQPRRLRAYLELLRASDRLAALAMAGDEQATLRATFDPSYHRLADRPRRLFRQLGIAPSTDFTPESAAALADTAPERARTSLQALADAYLLEHFAPGRYAFHDLLRVHAADRAREEDAGPDREAALQRLYDYYLHTTDRAAVVLHPQMLRLPKPAGPAPVAALTDRADALAWIDAERANLVAVIVHTANHGPPETAWLLADALRGYYLWRTLTVDWRTAAGAALAAADAAGDENAQAAAHWSLAGLGWRQNDYPRAITHAERALVLTQRTGWLAGQATALGNLGALYLESGQLEVARTHLTNALAVHEQTGRPPSPTVPSNLALTYLQAGQLARAAEHAERALAFNLEVGSRNLEAVSLGVLGEVHHAQGQLVLAHDELTRALASARTVGNRIYEGEILGSLAAVHRDAGRHTRALELAYDALSLADTSRHESLEIEALHTLGSVHHHIGNEQRAAGSFQRAVRLAVAATDPYPQAKALVDLASANRHLGQPERAHTNLARARAVAHNAGFRLVEGQALTVLAELHLDAAEAAAASAFARQAVTIHHDAGGRLHEARARLVLGRALLAQADPDGATDHWQHAYAIFAEIGAPEANQIRELLAGQAVPAGAGP
ncbi:MAG: tetratricopeptide repeat protein, partial [Micromonosporaceae bacterium]|nr:tetratricopeptide repeat protein [Micromonosporaceae bacterium]